MKTIRYSLCKNDSINRREVIKVDILNLTVRSDLGRVRLLTAVDIGQPLTTTVTRRKPSSAYMRIMVLTEACPCNCAECGRRLRVSLTQ